MVTSNIPLGRRLRAWRGRAFAVGFWLLCAGTSAWMLSSDTTYSGVPVLARVASAPLRVPESGRLIELRVSPGQKVAVGDILAVIEVPGLQQEIAAMAAEIKATQEEEGLTGADRDRRYARDLDGAKARWLSATVSLREEEARLAEAELLLGRMSAPGVVLPAIEVEGIRSRRDASLAAVAARRAEVDSLGRAMQSANSRAQNGEVDASASIEVLRLRMEALQARQDSLSLKAPQAGMVSGELPVTGSWVLAGQTLFEVTPPSTHEAVAWVLPAHAGSLVPGSTVALRGANGEMEATIRNIGASVSTMPEPLLRTPNVPEWRVPVLLEISGRDVVPGEVLQADF